MRIDFRQADWDKLANLWQQYYPEPYWVDAALLKQNTVGSPVFDWGASAIEVCDDEFWGFISVKRPANPTLYPGPNQDTYYLNAVAYLEPEVGVDIMSQVKKTLIDRGAQKLVFGTDSRHFFPGCPHECSKLCDFLMVEGFEKSGEHFDLERDLTDYHMPVTATPGVDFREATEKDMPAMKEFLQSEFPGRWTFDVLDKAKVEGASQTIYGAFEGGKVLGFALIQDSTHRQPIGGGIWRSGLGKQWGSLGPIGVAKSERGRGVGHALLGSALKKLQERGVKRCIIDWTTLGDFYGRHGFEITRRYQAATLKLD